MKKYFLMIETPDCFTPNADTVEIHIKGSPEGQYITAAIGTDAEAMQYKALLNSFFNRYVGGNNGK